MLAGVSIESEESVVQAVCVQEKVAGYGRAVSVLYKSSKELAGSYARTIRKPKKLSQPRSRNVCTSNQRKEAPTFAVVSRLPDAGLRPRPKRLNT